MNEEVRQGGYHTGPRLLCLLLVLWVTFVVGAAITQSAASNKTPQEIVARLTVTVSEALDEETEALVTALQTWGEAAIPSITAGLAQGGEQLRIVLTRVLGGIPGDASTSLLLELVGQRPSPGLVNRALSALQNREVRRPLSMDEIGSLSAQVREEDILTAGMAARVLGKCTMVPSDERLAPVAERFERELLSPSPVSLDPTSYLSPRVYVLNQFLLAVSYVGEAAIPGLGQKLQQAAGNSDLEKWLILALGMASDESVAADLKNVVLGEPDIYLRWAAVHAYARSAKWGAIPLLESLLTDTTESEYGSCYGDRVLLIRNAAKDELWRLRHENVASAKSQTKVAALASGKTHNARPGRHVASSSPRQIALIPTRGTASRATTPEDEPSNLLRRTPAKAVVAPSAAGPASAQDESATPIVVSQRSFGWKMPAGIGGGLVFLALVALSIMRLRRNGRGNGGRR